jgi:phage shock protein C
MSIKGPFRSPNGLIFGVVRGLADHYNISPFVLRLSILAASVFLAFWPVLLLYIAAAIVMPSEPKVLPLNERSKEVFLLGQVDPETLIEGLAARSESLERKIRRLEDHVTSKNFRSV